MLQLMPEKLSPFAYLNPNHAMSAIQISYPKERTAYVSIFSASGPKLAEKTVVVKTELVIK